MLAADYPFLDVMWTMLVFFIWIIWFWLLITVFADLFRRHDISGWVKALWIIFVIVLPFLGILIYLITQSHGIAERNVQQAKSEQEQLRQIVGTSPADELQKLDQLKASGSITDDEYQKLRAKAIG